MTTPTIQQQFLTSQFTDAYTGQPTSSANGGSNPFYDANKMSQPSFQSFDYMPTVTPSGTSTGQYPGSGGYTQGVNTSTPFQAPTFTDGYGGTYGSQAEATAAKTAKDNQRASFGVAQGNYKSGAQTALRDVGNEYDAKNTAFIDSVTQGQDQINTGLASNQLNLRQSMANIIKMVQNGIRSGGVSLANMNASNSGAVDALSRAYAKVGNEQTQGVTGQAATAAEDLQKQQGQLNLKKTQGETDMNTWKTTEADRVKNDFNSKLTTLKSQADTQGINGVVDTSLVDQVLNEAITRLSQIDQTRQTKLAGAQQWTPEQIMKEAIRLEGMGMGGTPFTTTNPNVSLGGNGAQAGAQLTNMPLYVKNRDQLTVAPTKKTQS